MILQSRLAQLSSAQSGVPAKPSPSADTKYAGERGGALPEEKGEGYKGPGGQLADAMPELKQEEGDASTSTRISPLSAQEMRRVSRNLNCVTTWLRVVHSGYGQEAWRDELAREDLTIVHAKSCAEGTYVL